MSNISHRIPSNLGADGEVTTFIPKGRTVYYVFFRLVVSGIAIQYSRSTGCKNKSEAVQVASEIFAIEALRARGKYPASMSALEPSHSCKSEECTYSARCAPILPDAKNRLDASIEEITTLFLEWVRSPNPHEAKRPSEKTAKGYVKRFMRMVVLLGSPKSFTELLLKVEKSSAQILGITRENYVPLVRNAASVFSKGALEYYKNQGLHISTPWPVLPCVEKKLFTPPPKHVLENLRATVRSELSKDVQLWPLFLLTYCLGLRVQEATHVQWQHVTEHGVKVSTDSHDTKSHQERRIRMSPELYAEFEALRTLPTDFCVPYLRRVGKMNSGDRCVKAAGKLAAWVRQKLGTDAEKANHILRKLFGSEVAQKHGVLTASRYLGHADTKITEEAYVGLLDTPEVELNVS